MEILPVKGWYKSLRAKIGDLLNLNTTSKTNLVSAINEVNGQIGNVVSVGSNSAITAAGTTSVTLTGLTANHKVVNWGLYSDQAHTTPISENSPPADITITTAADAYTIVVANVSSSFYIQPVFGLPQNLS